MPMGILSKFYVNTNTYADPTWVEIDLISDLTVKADWEEADGSVRRGQVTATEPTKMALEVTGKVRKDMGDTGFLAIRAAHRIKSVLDVLVLDGPLNVNGNEGFRFDGKVFQWSEDQKLGDVIYKDFNVKPCISANLPKSVIVNGGAPSYSAIGA